MSQPVFEKGVTVRSLNNPLLLGVVQATYWDDQLQEEYLEILFGTGIRCLPSSEVEVFNAENGGLWDDLVRLRLGHATSFHTFMTFERLRSPPSPITSAFGTARATFYPYQFKPLLKFLENPSQRILVADDVGLGKTIEAGYILREWRARHEVENVLVVVPARLQTKWKRELELRFDEDFEIVRSGEFRQVLHHLSLGRELPSFNWIVSYESVRSLDLVNMIEDLQPGIDLLIMDEAHRVRNRNTNQYKVAKALSECADAIVFLTATPVQTGLTNLYSLVNLLEPARFGYETNFQSMVDANRPIVRAGIQLRAGQFAEAINSLKQLQGNRFTRALFDDDYFKNVFDRITLAEFSDREALVKLQRDLSDFSLMGYLISRTRKIEVQEKWPKRTAQSPPIRLTDDEKAIYQAVRLITRLLHPEKSVWGQSMISLMAFRYTASCIPAAAKYLRNRLNEGGFVPKTGLWFDEVERDVLEDLSIINGNAAVTSTNKIAELVHEILRRCPNPGEDSKFRAFLKALRELWKDDQKRGEPDRKIVVFAFFKGTLNYLQEQLEDRDISCQLIHGDVPLPERQDRIEDFLESPEINVLLSSEVGGEGLDLQKASVVVNYDLPWNPMVVEQRIGRIDRIGQMAERLVVINLPTTETIEEEILYRLYDRIGIFEDTIGEIDDILGPKDIQNLMVRALQGRLTERELEEQVRLTLDAALRKKDQAGRLSKEVDALLAADQAFLDEIHNLQKRQRLPSAQDLKTLLMGVLERQFSGIQLAKTERKEILRLHLGHDAINQLRNWGRFYNQDGQRLAIRGEQGGIPVTFDAKTAMEHPRVEFVQARHTLIQFALYLLENDKVRGRSAFGLEIEGGGLPSGHWILGIWGVDLESTRARKEHRLEVVACRAEDGELLVGSEADDILIACLDRGKNLDPIPEIPVEALAECTRLIKHHFRQRYSHIVALDRESEQRRMARVKATWQQTLTTRYETSLHRLEGLARRGAKPVAIRLAGDQVKKRKAELDHKLAEFSERPIRKEANREVLAALVKII